MTPSSRRFTRRPTLRHLAGPVLLTGLLAAALPASAMEGSAKQLVGLINDYRSSEQTCAGSSTPAAGPLAPDDRLAAAASGAGNDMLDRLKANGYQAERVQLIEVGGPPDAESTMRVLAQNYCRALSNSRHAEIGVSQQGKRWRIVFARPLLAPDLADWPQAGRQILDLVNDARSKPRRCGDERLQQAPPLRWDGKLAKAALGHSRQMADDNFFSHSGKKGGKVSDRAEAAGYSWRRVGENIASGQGSTDAVVAAWLASPGHCANIMNPRFTEMGAAYAVNPTSDTTIYWTQVFGTPR
ncbi:CAP domain-containing protein [Piscinibacter sakaiensis]|uniref:CAP domain-containing protein n=1 Tax=Piscinibacter sakaiensis TaxID=1547922 RepID=UPI003AB0E495